MNSEQARALVTRTFAKAFDKGRFREFTVNLLNHMDGSTAQAWNSTSVKDAFKEHVSTFERLGTYTSPDDEDLDVLIVHLTTASKLERARTAIRNFVADYLKTRDGKDAALVAFVSPAEAKSWRFSYVTMEYAAVANVDGKVVVEPRLMPARRSSYIVGEGESCHTAKSRFLPLLHNTTDHPTLAQIAEAFSVEAVTEEFFREYVQLFETTEAALAAVVKRDKVVSNEFKVKGITTVDFAKKLLGQIMFLYFIQKKGWLGVAKGGKWGDGPRHFLRQLADRAIREKTALFNDVLEPLFYDTLATDRGHEAWCKTFECRIPFLNGGLFEPLAGYDWGKNKINLPNLLFTNQKRTDTGDVGTGILDVLDRYNFTVNESEPLEKEVAIDPEMLGKVFENLIEDNRRKGLGAFYTPREIVHFMCQDSLINYLDNRLNCRATPPAGRSVVVPLKDLEDWIHQSDQFAHYAAAIAAGTKGDHYPKPSESIRKCAAEIDALLRDITVCDPAIGSGAFPVGMMTEIVRARVALTPYFNDVADRTPYHFKRHAIQSCLYGADIDVGAVEIAKLRLWLSLVVDEENVQQVRPLPNLDYKVVAGNSLLGVETHLFNAEQFKRLDALKPRFFDETNRTKKRELKHQIEALIHDLTSGHELFDFEIYFSEVFHANRGFDVVIANPPYIKEYTERHAFDGLRDSPYYQGKMDLWYFFACKAFDLLRAESGILCFIATNNWVTNAGASTLREKIRTEATILKLLDFGAYQIFEAAAIQTMILLCLKSNANARYNFELRKIAQTAATLGDVVSLLNRVEGPKLSFLNPELDRENVKDSPLTFSDDATEVVLNKMRQQRNFSLDGDREVAQGIVSPQDFVNRATKMALGDGCEVGDGIFVLSTSEKSASHFTSEELKLIKPYYTTDELSRYWGTRRNRFWIIYTDSSFKTPIAIRPYPNIKKHLDRFGSVITSSNHPYGLHRSRRNWFFEGEKIISVRKCAEPTFTFTDFDCYVSQTFNVIKSNRVNMKYLTGVLNSGVVAFWLRHRGKMQGHQFQIDKEPLLAIPLILGHKDKQASIITLVDRILTAKVRDAKADVSTLEREIDELVYALYGLTQNEIRIVERVG